ncbi:MAG: sugar phosphate isomerase/epimerase [Victivallales bacterium]|nr:sugar phosphate isomerase/epimerase [Victivallales bacterium]
MSSIALQLYSIRNELSRDYTGTIDRIAAFGYTGAEFAACPSGISLEQCAEILERAGLRVPSMHVPVPSGPNRNLIFDNAHNFGCKYLVCGKRPDDFKTPDAIRKSCDDFNFAAAEASRNGLKLAIHNHWWEYQEIDGIPVYKTMLENLSPEVLFELDTYWVKVGGQDPAAVLDELASRIPLVHIKDGSGIPGDFNMKAAGQGVMDFGPVFSRVKNAEWLICELDACESDMLQAVKESYVYISENK